MIIECPYCGEKIESQSPNQMLLLHAKKKKHFGMRFVVELISIGKGEVPVYYALKVYEREP